jgi:hypothetical protein
MDWTEIDRLQTAEEIADYLRVRDVRGWREDVHGCPLARATGWHVGQLRRLRCSVVNSEIELLTPAEQDFVKRFDAGEYPDLVEED